MAHFLRGNQTPDEYLHDLARAPGAYNGFNLLASDLHDLWWYSNRSKSRKPQKLKPSGHRKLPKQKPRLFLLGLHPLQGFNRVETLKKACVTN